MSDSFVFLHNCSTKHNGDPQTLNFLVLIILRNVIIKKFTYQHNCYIVYNDLLEEDDK